VSRLDYDLASRSYDSGRATPEAARAHWRQVLGQVLVPTPRLIVDVGAGTGIWSASLAEWFSCHIAAVEPSRGMRKRAQEMRPHARVQVMAGAAEALPLRAATCDAAWLSTVLHHVDLARTAAECCRVVKPGGHVIIRSSFRTAATTWP
jgi:ubiquinone/menaquinone biosynthesis C-methylase UbiE